MAFSLIPVVWRNSGPGITDAYESSPLYDNIVANFAAACRAGKPAAAPIYGRR